MRYARSVAAPGFCLLAACGFFGSISLALAQPALTPAQAEALSAYNRTVQEFKAVLAERRAQINAKQKLSEKPGQALYLYTVEDYSWWAGQGVESGAGVFGENLTVSGATS